MVDNEEKISNCAEILLDSELHEIKDGCSCYHGNACPMGFMNYCVISCNNGCSTYRMS